MGCSSIYATCICLKIFNSLPPWRANALLSTQIRPLHASFCSADLPSSANENGFGFRNLQRLQYRNVSFCAGKGSDIYKKNRATYDDFCGLMPDGSKATTYVHSVWQHTVKDGDVVIDATCGNGYDTVLLAKLISGKDFLGCVYAFDIQEVALHNASLLMDRELSVNQRRQVRLVQTCHSKIETVVNNRPVRLVAFNLGYLPGGDKGLVTCSTTTLAALHAATKCLQSGGLISIVAYVGHPGGREEYDAVKAFLSALPTADWVCSHLEWLNRPLGPRVLFGFRK